MGRHTLLSLLAPHSYPPPPPPPPVWSMFKRYETLSCDRNVPRGTLFPSYQTLIPLARTRNDRVWGINWANVPATSCRAFVPGDFGEWSIVSSTMGLRNPDEDEPWDDF